jgi:hypothetical protein
MRVVARKETHSAASRPTGCDTRFRDAIFGRHESFELVFGVGVRGGGVLSQMAAFRPYIPTLAAFDSVEDYDKDIFVLEKEKLMQPSLTRLGWIGQGNEKGRYLL